MDKLNLGVLLLATSILLSACGQRNEDGTTDSTGQPDFNTGGDVDNGTDGDGDGGSADELSLRVLSNVNSINTGGTDVANITALVTDENNNALADTPVTFSSTGGVLQNISETTDENGEASATLKLPQDFQNRDIIVTVASGSNDAEVKVTALGSTLEVTGPDTLVLGDKAELVLSLIAGNGEPISNQVIDVTSSVGNSIEPSLVVTDPDGRVSILVGSDNSDDKIRISALNSTVTATHSFEVAEDVLRFASNTSNAELPVSQNNRIVVFWSSQGSVVSGRELRFSTTAGEIVGDSTVLTDATGKATILLRSSSAGPAKVTVEGAQAGNPKTSVDVEFVATVPGDVSIDATTTRVHANEASTLMALVTDDNGNPVKNQTVDFTSVDLKGGQLNPASAKTNSSGVASVAFTAGANATELDDILIEARVKGTELMDELNLTVVERALNVTIGTSNEINIKPLGTQYALPFIVQVADGSGTPLEDATVKLSIRPIRYTKGYMVLVNEGGFEYAPDIENWSAHHWAMFGGSVNCDSEDDNGNRLLDSGEDFNNNGSLDPQDPAALAAIDDEDYATISGGSLTTDKNGSGYFEMLYPASNSLWSYVEITARAEALGAEADDSFRTTLPLPSSEVTKDDEIPANHISPYGSDLDCSNTN
ncbi:Ig-like domain-containing protein [Granulosicoccus sp. 3-233]|uniref:Ig-like domain-containing protein n=1 Tax=Granulosicoccus sp. 3-233 TaxID=3417969 RepID=UPI003D336416